MSSQLYSGTKYESTRSESARAAGDASRALLLEEYRTPLRASGYLRILNRALMVALIGWQIGLGPLPFSRQVFYVVAACIVACFWWLQELLTAQRLSRLGELIAATDAEFAGEGEKELDRKPVLPVLKGKQDDSTGPVWTGAAKEQAQSSSPQTWTSSYIDWRHAAWKERRLLAFQRSEPAFWFLIEVALGVLRVMGK